MGFTSTTLKMKTSSPSQAFDSMTDAEKNIFFLKTFFAPKAKPYCLGTSKKDLATTYMWYWIPSGKPRRTHEIDAVAIPDFLTNWNVWRSLEEKVMEDVVLWTRFMQSPLWSNDVAPPLMQWYMQTDLPTRVKALYMAYHDMK